MSILFFYMFFCSAGASHIPNKLILNYTPNPLMLLFQKHFISIYCYMGKESSSWHFHVCFAYNVVWLDSPLPSIPSIFLFPQSSCFLNNISKLNKKEPLKGWFSRTRWNLFLECKEGSQHRQINKRDTQNFKNEWQKPHNCLNRCRRGI
jgi:hypothetical protein